jgi:hypothetical protein
MATNKETLRKAAESPDLTGVLDLSAKGRPSLDADREPMFKIGDTVYTMPKVCPPGASLEYLRLAGMAGEQTALIYAMQRLIGVEGYIALVGDATLTVEELAEITRKVIAKVVTGFTLPKA